MENPGKDDDLEIIIDDDGGIDKKAKEPEVVVVEPTKKRELSPDEGIDELRRKLANAEHMAAQERARADAATRQAVEARNDKDDTDLHLINNAIDTLRRETDYLKAEYRSAMSISDFDKSAEIQNIMAANAAKLLQLENGKVAMEARPKQAPPPPRRQGDPVEEIASTLSPRSAAWVRAHPEYARDDRMLKKLANAHEIAVLDGNAVDTDDYFAAVEDVLRIPKQDTSSAQADSPLSGAAAPTQRRSTPPPAAPVSRSGTASGHRPGVVRLSAAEVDAAKMSGITPQEYYRQKMRIEQEKANQ